VRHFPGLPLDNLTVSGMRGEEGCWPQSAARIVVKHILVLAVTASAMTDNRKKVLA